METAELALIPKDVSHLGFPTPIIQETQPWISYDAYCKLQELLDSKIRENDNWVLNSTNHL